MVNYNVISTNRPRNRYTNSIKAKPTSTIAKFPLSTKSNKPVLRKLQKPTKSMTKTNRNQNAIMTLAKQVKTLQNQRFGEIQTHTQRENLLSTYNSLPSAGAPVAFMLNSFYDQYIYKGVVTNGFASYTQIAQLTRFQYQSDLNDEYEWNARQNVEAVSPIMYKPVYTRARITFHTSTQGSSIPIKYRVTLFKIKNYLPSNKIQCTLPSSLGAYRNMCISQSDSKRNFFDKKYHTVMYDKWITIDPNNKTASETDTSERTCVISWKYNDVVYKPDMHSASETFWSNTKQEDQMWVLISASEHSEGKLTKVELSKFDVWRDPHGVD